MGTGMGMGAGSLDFMIGMSFKGCPLTDRSTQVIVKYHKEKTRYTGTMKNHMDKNITCKGKEWNSEIHRMKRIGVMGNKE